MQIQFYKDEITGSLLHRSVDISTHHFALHEDSPKPYFHCLQKNLPEWSWLSVPARKTLKVERPTADHICFEITLRPKFGNFERAHRNETFSRSFARTFCAGADAAVAVLSTSRTVPSSGGVTLHTFPQYYTVYSIMHLCSLVACLHVPRARRARAAANMAFRLEMCAHFVSCLACGSLNGCQIFLGWIRCFKKVP